MAYNKKDYYYREAKKQNFAARSVFKLEEIQARFKILKKGQTVLDLGAAPGSWSQYCSQVVGEAGKILGIDLEPIHLTLPNAVFIREDLKSLNLEDAIKKAGFEPPFDVVLSDMAPKTTGIREADQARSLALCELALWVASQYLKPEGTFVCKLFHSGAYESFRAQLRKSFKKVETVRPQSTRKESKEIFLLGLGLVGTGARG